jgi:hypothetical protein
MHKQGISGKTTKLMPVEKFSCKKKPEDPGTNNPLQKNIQ